MPKVPSPIVGGWQVSSSLPAADNELYNLEVKAIETKDGVVPAYLALTDGLDLLVNVDDGPTRAIAQLNGTLYVLSGITLYSVSTALVVTALGNITSAGVSPVSMFSNTTQLMLVDGYNAWVVPGGVPLTGGSITGGSGYVVGDTIVLGGGSPSAKAIIEVTGVSTGAVSSYNILQAGAWLVAPGTVTQVSTSGSGSGFELTSATFGTAVGMAPIAMPFSYPIAGGVSDGFGLVVFKTSQNIAQSVQADLSVWDALAYGVADESPDNCVSLAIIHDQVYIIKEQNTEVWVDEGLENFAFAPLQGVHMEYGIAAPFSVAKCGEDLVWLSVNSQGEGIVVRVSGYSPASLSTQSLVREFQTYKTISDAIAYSYQNDGRTFYVINFPSANATWCCDLTTSDIARQPVWHRRAAFTNGQWMRHWGNAYCWWGGTETQPNIGVVGDYQSGNLYTFVTGGLTDNGTARRWLRRWRALPKATSLAMRFYSLFVRMQTGGANIPVGTNPNMSLRWSDDGGQSWSNERIMPLGPVGETAQWIKFNRLGATRRYGGSSRVFELSSADQFPVALLEAEVDAG